MPDRSQSAETLALRVLAWLAARDDLLERFLAQTGADLATLRAEAGTAEVQLAVLDFLLLDDQWVIAFCQEAGVDFAEPARARQLLAGAAGTHWT